MRALLMALAIAGLAPAPRPSRGAPLDVLLKVTGISATPSTQKGPAEDADAAGEIWIADVAARTQRRVSRTGDYRSPVFQPGDQAILALRGATLVRIALPGGEARALHTLQGASKLVGFRADDPDQLLVLFEDAERGPSLGFLALGAGQVLPVPVDRSAREQRALLAHVREWERVYGATSVYVKAEVKQGVAGAVEWTDVYLKPGAAEPVNLSRCDGLPCGQPTLSPDGRQVAFVKLRP